MSLAQFTDWVLNIPRRDQDMPTKSIDGKNYTPRQLLKEAQQGTPLGQKALQLFAEGKLVGSPPGASERQLAIDRIKIRYAEMDQDTPVLLTLKVGQQEIKPREILEAVEINSELGQEIIRLEEEYLQYLKDQGTIAKQGG